MIPDRVTNKGTSHGLAWTVTHDGQTYAAWVEAEWCGSYRTEAVAMLEAKAACASRADADGQHDYELDRYHERD